MKLSTSNTEALNNEAKEAYKAKIAEYAQYQGGNKNAVSASGSSGVNNSLLMSGKQDISYTLYDLNGDGVDELLVRILYGSSLKNDDIKISDAFTYVDGRVKRIFAAGQKSDYHLYKDGYICYHLNGGADASSQEFSYYKYVGDFVFIDENDDNSGAEPQKATSGGSSEPETITWTPITQNL